MRLVFNFKTPYGPVAEWYSEGILVDRKILDDVPAAIAAFSPKGTCLVEFKLEGEEWTKFQAQNPNRAPSHQSPGLHSKP